MRGMSNMDDKFTWNQFIKENILQLIIGSLFAGFMYYLGTYFGMDDIMVRVGNSIKINDSSYIVNIDIYNYKNNNLDNILLSLPGDMEIDDIKSNVSVNVDVENNSIDGENTVFNLEEINKKDIVSLAIISNDKIDVNDIEVNSNYKTSIKYADNEDSKFNASVKNTLALAIVYIPTSCVVSFIFEKRMYKKKKEIADELVDKLNNKLTTAQKDIEADKIKIKEVVEELNKISEENKELKISNAKQKTLLLSRIKDYKKELDFWHDTIRKVLYTQEFSKKEINKIFENVTCHLKTYGTLKEKDINYDDIKILADMLRDKK